MTKSAVLVFLQQHFKSVLVSRSTTDTQQQCVYRGLNKSGPNYYFADFLVEKNI